MHGKREGEGDGQGFRDHRAPDVYPLQARGHDDHHQGQERRQVPVVIVDGRDEIDAIGEEEPDKSQRRPPARDLTRRNEPDRKKVGHDDGDHDQDRTGQGRRGRAPDLVKRLEVIEEQLDVPGHLPEQPLQPRQR